MQNGKENVVMVESKNEEKKRNCYTGRPDYYPFNQAFLDDYYKSWENRSSKN